MIISLIRFVVAQRMCFRDLTEVYIFRSPGRKDRRAQGSSPRTLDIANRSLPLRLSMISPTTVPLDEPARDDAGGGREGRRGGEVDSPVSAMH